MNGIDVTLAPEAEAILRRSTAFKRLVKKTNATGWVHQFPVAHVEVTDGQGRAVVFNLALDTARE